MAQSPFKDADRLAMNRTLKELEALEAAIKDAEKASVPRVDELAKRCSYCRENIEKMKAVYFKGKP